MSLKTPRACLLSRWRGANFYSQHYWYMNEYSLQGSGKWSKLQGWLCDLLISGLQFFVIPFYNSGGMEGVWVGLLRGLIWEFLILFWVWSCIYYCHTQVLLSLYWDFLHWSRKISFYQFKHNIPGCPAVLVPALTLAPCVQWSIHTLFPAQASFLGAVQLSWYP